MAQKIRRQEEQITRLNLTLKTFKEKSKSAEEHTDKLESIDKYNADLFKRMLVKNNN